MTPLYYVKHGNLGFGNKVVLDNIEFYVYPKDKICLIGRNGSGKSSLMKVISGIYELDSGELFHNKSATVGYLKQDNVIDDPNWTIYKLLLKDFKDPGSEKYQADMILSKLQLDGNMTLGKCSGGQIRRAVLAKSLIANPEILLLDEPTNHLDIETITWLEEFVKSYQGSIICISHDKMFLKNVTNKIWWIDRGILRKSDKGFQYYEQWQDEILKVEEATLQKLTKKLESETEWLHAGVTARRKRNQKRLSDLKSLRQKVQIDNNRFSNTKRKIYVELDEDVKKSKFIIEAKNVSFNYNNKKVVQDFTFKVKKGEKIGIVGPNGSGKSTLIKLLTRELIPSFGEVKHGTNLEITYFDQSRSELNPNHSLQEVLCPNGSNQVFLHNRILHVAAYLKEFLFDPKLANAKVSTLSGGEASRLLLAQKLITPGNLLILDEPTNDLDMDTLEILLEILFEYNGTLIVVSHDRDFLDRITTRTLVFDNQKIWDIVGGGYDDYKHIITPQTVKNPPTKSQVIKEKSHDNTNSISTKKLSYKDQRSLEILPTQIELLESNIKELEHILSDNNLYLQSPDKYNKLSIELNASKARLDQLMLEWFELSQNSNSKIK